MELPVYLVRVKDGSSTCLTLTVAAFDRETAEGYARKMAADKYAPGFENHYRVSVLPKLHNGLPMRIHVAGVVADG